MELNDKTKRFIRSKYLSRRYEGGKQMRLTVSQSVSMFFFCCPSVSSFVFVVLFVLSLFQAVSFIFNLTSWACLNFALMTKFLQDVKIVSLAGYRWLAKDEDDGLIVRELPLGGTSLLNSACYSTFICCLHK